MGAFHSKEKSQETRTDCQLYSSQRHLRRDMRRRHRGIPECRRGVFGGCSNACNDFEAWYKAQLIYDPSTSRLCSFQPDDQSDLNVVNSQCSDRRGPYSRAPQFGRVYGRVRVELQGERVGSGGEGTNGKDFQRPCIECGEPVRNHRGFPVCYDCRAEDRRVSRSYM